MNFKIILPFLGVFLVCQISYSQDVNKEYLKNNSKFAEPTLKETFEWITQKWIHSTDSSSHNHGTWKYTMFVSFNDSICTCTDRTVLSYDLKNGIIKFETWDSPGKAYGHVGVTRLYIQNLDIASIQWNSDENNRLGVGFSVKSMNHKVAGIYDYNEIHEGCFEDCNGHFPIDKVTLYFNKEYLKDIPNFQDRFTKAFKHLINLVVLNLKKERF